VVERSFGAGAQYLACVSYEAMNLRRAAAAAAATGRPELRGVYLQAVARGAHNTQCTAEQESAYGTLRLLTLATLRLPDLVLYAHLLHVSVEDGDHGPLRRPVVRGASDIASGALRLAHRALETHAQAVHFDTDAWMELVVRHAERELDDAAHGDEAAMPLVIEQARRAAIALTRATAATANDPIRVAEQLAAGLGHLLAVYLIASEAARG
jgi:hypothetical protein